jgi:hypothetical protein
LKGSGNSLLPGTFPAYACKTEEKHNKFKSGKLVYWPRNSQIQIYSIAATPYLPHIIIITIIIIVIVFVVDSN